MKKLVLAAAAALLVSGVAVANMEPAKAPVDCAKQIADCKGEQACLDKAKEAGCEVK